MNLLSAIILRCVAPFPKKGSGPLLSHLFLAREPKALSLQGLQQQGISLDMKSPDREFDAAILHSTISDIAKTSTYSCSNRFSKVHGRYKQLSGTAVGRIQFVANLAEVGSDSLNN